MYVACLVCWCSGLAVISSPNEARVHLLPLEVRGANRAERRYLWPSFLSYPAGSFELPGFLTNRFTTPWVTTQGHGSPACTIASQSEVTKTNLSIGIDWPWQKGKWTLNWGGLGENEMDSAACGRFLEEKKLSWGKKTNGVLNSASCCGGLEQSERRSLSSEKMFRVLCYQKPRTFGTQ